MPDSFDTPEEPDILGDPGDVQDLPDDDSEDLLTALRQTPPTAAAKPAVAKDKFVLAGDKGAKVLVYLSLEPDSMMQPGFGFKYTVNRSQDGKEEWIDERLLALKPTARYSMAAFTLTEPGRYHFLVTDQQDERKVYAEGWATVVQE